ncbi:protein LAZ1, partial [Tanacetum coccineum]
QKAKIEWLEAGDSNSTYFHKSIKSRNQRCRIDVITTTDNEEITGPGVSDVFVSHYEAFIGTDLMCKDLDSTGLFSKHLLEESNAHMTRQKGWDVVGHDVCKAVQDLFSNRKVLKEINHTFLALIPKVTTPLKGIKEVVSDNQSAFMPGRQISDNILITQELLHNYHRNRGPPRCAFKVDIQKAYDTVDWHFWVISSRSLDSIQPWQEGPSSRRPSLALSFHFGYEDFDSYYSKEDDLFIFARGEVDSARVIMDSLDEFKWVSRLISSIPKSAEFFCNVVNHVKMAILNIMPFLKESSRLNTLLFLLFPPGSLIGIAKSFVLGSVLFIPLGIVSDIQQLIRGFLWCNGNYKRGKAKVAWGDICLPMHEGRLESWLLKAPYLRLIPSLNIDPSCQDSMMWCDRNGNMQKFFVKCAWEELRPRGNEVAWIYTILNAPAGRLLGAYDLEVATPRAVVHAGDKTSGDARSWYMISRDAKSWVCDCFTYIHCVFDKGKWLVLEINDVHPWGFGIQD